MWRGNLATLRRLTKNGGDVDAKDQHDRRAQ